MLETFSDLLRFRLNSKHNTLGLVLFENELKQECLLLWQTIGLFIHRYSTVTLGLVLFENGLKQECLLLWETMGLFIHSHSGPSSVSEWLKTGMFTVVGNNRVVYSQIIHSQQAV